MPPAAFFDACHIAELAPCLELSLAAAHAMRHQLVRFLLQMLRDLFTEVGVESPSRKKLPQPPHDFLPGCRSRHHWRENKRNALEHLREA
jgi:hypothetical protein